MTNEWVTILFILLYVDLAFLKVFLIASYNLNSYSLKKTGNQTQTLHLQAGTMSLSYTPIPASYNFDSGISFYNLIVESHRQNSLVWVSFRFSRRYLCQKGQQWKNNNLALNCWYLRQWLTFSPQKTSIEYSWGAFQPFWQSHSPVPWFTHMSMLKYDLKLVQATQKLRGFSSKAN